MPADRHPDYQRGEVPAAGESAGGGGDRNCAPYLLMSCTSSAVSVPGARGRALSGQAGARRGGENAWRQALPLIAVRQSPAGLELPAFAHGRCVEVGAQVHLLDTYHPSRQNTNTGRLTERCSTAGHGDVPGSCSTPEQPGDGQQPLRLARLILPARRTALFELPDTPRAPPRSRAIDAMPKFDHEAYLKTLPNKPGVYRMQDAAGAVLYVGKARNLKNRVSSYFRASGLTAKTMALVNRIDDIKVTVTHSETEALLLEQSMIKEDRPPYNIVLRDDKSYPFIYLTDHADFPRLTFHRGAKRRTGRYFGPFPSAGAVRDSLNILQKLFRLRHCEDTFFKNRSRPCLQYQIERCSGPCVGLVEPEQYQEDVELAVMFLEGKSNDVLDHFKRRMEEASCRARLRAGSQVSGSDRPPASGPGAAVRARGRR